MRPFAGLQQDIECKSPTGLYWVTCLQVLLVVNNLCAAKGEAAQVHWPPTHTSRPGLYLPIGIVCLLLVVAGCRLLSARLQLGTNMPCACGPLQQVDAKTTLILQHGWRLLLNTMQHHTCACVYIYA